MTRGIVPQLSPSVAEGIATATGRSNERLRFAAVTAKQLTYVDDVPDDVEAQLSEICLSLPDAFEQPAWKGTRWKVRNRTFASVLAIEFDGSDRSVVVAFRSTGEELEVLLHAGPPFIVLGWGRDAIGLVIDDRTDWGEVHELIVESYCAMAPKKLVALVDRPPDSL